MAKAPKFCPECGAELGENKICEKCGYETSQTVKKEAKTQPTPSGGGNPNWENIESFVTILGKWAWVIVIINGLIYIFSGIWGLIWTIPAIPYGATLGISTIWNIIGGIVVIILAIIIIKPRFSSKCAAKDWDYLLNDVLTLGNFRIPWMLIWGIIIEIFGNWWGGLPIIIPALLLIFMGPKPYDWTTD